MGGQIETFKDREGKNHLIFDKSALYKDLNFGDKLSDFEVLRVLGAFKDLNVISKVRSLKNNKLYAMKKVELDKIVDERERQLCLDQMEKLKTINHPHLLEYYKTFKDENNNIYMIYEYMNNSDLNSFIKAHQYLGQNIKEEQIWNILLQCLSGLEYLHSKNLESLAIKPTNIFLNNEQNAKIGLFYDTPKLADKNYYKKNDIYFIGLYFYKMVFSQFDFLKFSSWIDDFPVQKIKNKFYSEELLTIIYEMINNNPNNLKTASELNSIAKKAYDNKYANNTSISAVLRCLFSFPEFSKFFLKNENYIKENQDKCPVCFWFLKVINSLTTDNPLNECVDEYRRALALDNTKLDGNKEIDPVYILAFLFEKIHMESINKPKTEVKKKDLNELYVINSRYKVEGEEGKENKDQMLNKFMNYFSYKVKSVISNSFFGFMKRKRICQGCKNGSYSFSNFCFIPYDLTKFNNIQCFDLVNNGFIQNHYECKVIKNVYCNTCLTEQTHKEFNRIYTMGLHLTICFYRGNNYENDLIVNFPDDLDFNNSPIIEGSNAPNKFRLIGSINRIINNGKEEFIYFAKDPFKANYWRSSYGDGDQNNAPINIIQKYGKIIMLFYTSL